MKIELIPKHEVLNLIKDALIEGVGRAADEGQEEYFKGWFNSLHEILNEIEDM